jgi:uncharacterized phage-associated protein
MISTDSLAKLILSYGDMSNKKLQKLSYYVYSWHLAIFEHTLSDTYFEAWRHGPVSPQIYNKYKIYGWDDIPQYRGFLLVDSDDIEFSNRVLDYYYQFTADELEEMTHNELPWSKARGNIEKYQSSNSVISKLDIMYFYKLQKDIKNKIMC